MSDFVRVYDKAAGFNQSVPRGFYEANADAYDLLEADAIDRNGWPLPAALPEDEPVTDPLEEMDADGLKAYAEVHGIDVGRSSSEDGLRGKIREAQPES